MPKGPQLNNISKSFTKRDSLGIESVASSIAREICPVVTNVTYRAFYWAFMVWIYYDFYKYSGIEEKNDKNFASYLKRQDYYFVLATLLNSGSDRTNLEGIQNTQYDVYFNRSGKYPFNPKYLDAHYGGMRNYGAGCMSMRFIVDYNPESGMVYKFPKLTKDGEKLAIAFEKVIKGTQYYKKYRLFESEVPASVLQEYGKSINLGLVGFDECKILIREKLLETQLNYKQSESAAYIKYLNEAYGVEDFDRPNLRKALFDYLTPTDKNIVIEKRLETISNEWEIVVGRQYFTAGLEMIWKYMLEQLNEPYTKKQWIAKVINQSEHETGLDQPVSDLLGRSEFDYDTRENMISIARAGNDRYAVENGVMIILSIYNHFINRDDLGDDRLFFDYGIDSNSISFTEMIEGIEKHKDSTIKEFMIFVMDEWLIQQHYITAFEKMLQGRDGFYYSLIDGQYIKRENFDINFQGIRLTNLAQIMRDLEVI